MKKALLVICLLFAITSTSFATEHKTKGNTTITSFDQSKRFLLERVYDGHYIDFYCKAKFDNKKHITNSNNYLPKKESERSQRIECDHVVQAWHFGQSFFEWREGHPECVDKKGKPFKGRKCAEKINEIYRLMQADMYNLVPAIGEINGLRSNNPYGMIAGEDRDFGSCNIEIKDGVVEPPEDVWGDIARIYFYMKNAYPNRGVLSGKNKKLFEAWDRTDPVDSWECERSKRIEAIQGNENPFVKKPCQAKGMW